MVVAETQDARHSAGRIDSQSLNEIIVNMFYKKPCAK